MTWSDLLFAHWPIPPSSVQPLLPRGLLLDTFDNWAWIGVVPFRMSHVRRRPMPVLPWFSRFPELNVRTYVRSQDKPGVWFFSLDAASSLAVAVARRRFYLAYYRARMSCVACKNEIHYTSRRTHRGAASAKFRARYYSTGPVVLAGRGSLEHWLTERYCLYAADARDTLYRGEIHHSPWPLEPAEAEILENSMTEAAGITLPKERPVLHFARRLETLAWEPIPVS